MDNLKSRHEGLVPRRAVFQTRPSILLAELTAATYADRSAFCILSATFGKLFRILKLTRATFFLLLVGFSNLAFAEACIQIVDDEERLACFDATRACATIQSKSGRLDCFDRAYLGADSTNAQAEVRNMPVEVQVEPDASVDQSNQVQSPDEVTASPENFGKKKTIDAPKENIEATIVEVKTNALKIDYLRLDNGHIWRESEDRRIRFRVGQKVRIEEGIFGSFNLTVEGSEKFVKVKRVR